MAILLRGKRKGEEVKLHQFCNDWITTEDNLVLSPLSVQLNFEEVELVREAERWNLVGHMFMLYDLSDDGRFTKREHAD